MRTFRSKSNFMFGTIMFSAVLITEIPVAIKVFSTKNPDFLAVAFVIVPLLVAAYLFIQGIQVIKIDDRGVTLEVFYLPLKELRWLEVNEAGTGKIKIGKNKYVRQLYLSHKQLTEEQTEDLDTMRFDNETIWFDYSQKAREKLEYYLFNE